MNFFGEIIIREGCTCLFDSMVKSLYDDFYTVLDLFVIESPFYDLSLRDVLLEKRERER
jgi:hypothetical protein